MGRIFVTGDTHQSIDISKLNTTKFPEQRKLSKDDYVIVAGDFGMLWNDSKEEHYWRNWLNEKTFTTLFVDGNHENFDMLNNYPISEWNGGKVHFITPSIIHLMRGQVFEIDGIKIFTMGGATSMDKERRVEYISWWKEEMPNHNEYSEAMENLDRHNWKVDYIITHCPPGSTTIKIFDEMFYEPNSITQFLEMVEERLEYRKWFAGHLHVDADIKDVSVLFDRIIEMN